MKNLEKNKLFILLQKNNITVSVNNNYAETSFITKNDIEINSYFFFTNQKFIEFVNNFNISDEVLNINIKNLSLNDALIEITEYHKILISITKQL